MFFVLFFAALALLLWQYFWHYGIWLQYQQVLANPAPHHKIAMQGTTNELIVRLIYLFGYAGITLLGPLCAWLIWRLVVRSKATKRLVLLPLFLWLATALVGCFWVAEYYGQLGIPWAHYAIVLSATFSITLLLLWGRQVYDDATIRRIVLCLVVLLIFYLFQRANSQSGYGHMGFLYLGLAFMVVLPMMLMLMRGLWLRFFTVSNMLLLGVVIPMLINIFPTIEDGYAMPIWRNTVMVSRLGTFVDPAQAKIWARIGTLYDHFGCSKHYFLSFYDIPMSYYLLQREAPYQQSWLSRMDFYPTNVSIDSSVVLRDLQQSKHWCVVFAAPEQAVADHHNDMWLVQAYRYISEKSQHRIRIGIEPARQRTYWFFAN